MPGTGPGDAAAGTTFRVGDLINNTYRIEALLGQGGTSEVYRAKSEVFGRVVALKVLKAEFASNDDYLVLIQREEEIRDITHPAVVRYSDTGRTADGSVYLVMDYVDGPALNQVVEGDGMAPGPLLTLARRVAEGLRAVHSHNIVHRDLSPDNLILRHGQPEETVIIDFGIAKDTNPGAATIVGNEFAGKYAYAAPEQLHGQADARSDLYALGAVLLSAYRGEAPSLGTNVMDMVKAKMAPLETAGLPEPLKTLIDRLASPAPEERFQSAEAVLAFLDGSAPAALPLDGTIIAPIAPGPNGAPRDTLSETSPLVAGAPEPNAAAHPTPHPTRDPTPPPPVQRRSPFLPILLGLVLLIGGVGVFVSGAADRFFASGPPAIAPYTLSAAKPAGGAPSLTGHAPSEAVRSLLTETLSELGGSAQLTLASGTLPQNWGGGVVGLLELLAPLEEWSLEVSDARARITGLTEDRTLHAQLSALLRGPAAPGPFETEVALTLGPRLLTTERVEAALKPLADCGPLSHSPPEPAGYPLGARIQIAGDVSDPATRGAIFDALSAIAGDRTVVVGTSILNQPLCLINQRLPDAPPAGIEVAFGFGRTGAPNPSGVYTVGDNPTIDVILPEAMTDGFVWVLIVDVTGNVYHLFPNIHREESAVAAIPLVDGRHRLRVGHAVAEAQADSTKLAFEIDETFGKSKILVLHADAPIFDGIRPTTESVESFAAALDAQIAARGFNVDTVDVAIIETATAP